MPTTTELKMAVDTANVWVAALEKQLMEAADREVKLSESPIGYLSG